MMNRECKIRVILRAYVREDRRNFSMKCGRDEYEKYVLSQKMCFLRCVGVYDDVASVSECGDTLFHVLVKIML